jgi:transcriptional regulator with XRE-family HTH domain
MATFGRTLEALATARGMDQTELAKASGIDQSSISKVYNGRIGMTPDKASRVLMAFPRKEDKMSIVTALIHDFLAEVGHPEFQVPLNAGDDRIATTADSALYSDLAQITEKVMAGDEVLRSFVSDLVKMRCPKLEVVERPARREAAAKALRSQGKSHPKGR